MNYPIEFYGVDLVYWTNVSQMEHISEFEIQTQKKGTLTLHMTKEGGKYYEKTFELKEDEIFNFKEYLKDVVYLGVQCTYSYPEIEVEEKFIVVGQKGMLLSGMLKTEGGELIYPLLPFRKEYQILYSESMDDISAEKKEFYDVKSGRDWKRVEVFPELMNHLKNDEIKFYELDAALLREEYLDKLTYSNQKIYSLSQERFPSHVNLEVCTKCKMQAKCMQAVPSGLSYLLFKRNIGFLDVESCDVYKVLKEKE